jgi:uncharacterized LabA/DUF88 family protein
MAEPAAARVAVYIDFDNIVIGRYDQVHGRSSYHRDRARATDAAAETEFAERLGQATVDLGAIIDFASSFGTLVLTRAYADWSAAVNAAYRDQLVGRAVDLVQLFPAAAYAKNGADIRLAVDAVEDMFRLPDLTHVVIVAGDSDYIALAQRCKRLGRYVVGIGVAGSTSRSLGAACDELVTYDALPGVPRPVRDTDEQQGELQGDERRGTRRSGRRSAKRTPAVDEPMPESAEQDAQDAQVEEDDEDDVQAAATDLLQRALRLGQEKDDADWLHNSAVKTQMKRMDPSFSERALGFRSFSDFLRSRGDLVELDESSTARLVRLADPADRRG